MGQQKNAGQSMEIIIASSNKHKVLEYKKIFNASGIEVQGLPEGMNFEPPEENGNSFSENADIKARYYSALSDTWVLADDSGLCADMLDGKPGIYSSRFAGPDATDRDNVNKLLELMKNLNSPGERKACFICCISLARKGKIIKKTTGKVTGYILNEPAGTGGFGYDPVFFYKPFKKTFAEIPDEAKNQISHRFRASKKLVNFILKNINIRDHGNQ